MTPMVALNPWLTIPASEYEAHMGDPNVDQLQFLGRILGEALEAYRPESVAVLGCATGNGFERIDLAATKKIFGIDINKQYLEIASKRHSHRLEGLSLVCSDLFHWKPSAEVFDLVYAALIFEYLEPELLLERIQRSLKPDGKLVVVFQLANYGGAVSCAGYSGLRSLEETISLVEPESFRDSARSADLAELEGRVEQLESGKSFYVGHFIRDETRVPSQ